MKNISIHNREKTKEEWSREYAGEIGLSDFDTSHPNRNRLNNLAKSLRFNAQIKQSKIINYGKF